MKAAFVTALAFLLVLTAAVVTLVVMNAPVGCGCGLPGLDTVAGPFHIIRNVVLLLFAGLGWALLLSRRGPGTPEYEQMKGLLP